MGSPPPSYHLINPGWRASRVTDEEYLTAALHFSPTLIQSDAEPPGPKHPVMDSQRGPVVELQILKAHPLQ
jgi:hypothetical protein